MLAVSAFRNLGKSDTFICFSLDLTYADIVLQVNLIPWSTCAKVAIPNIILWKWLIARRGRKSHIFPCSNNVATPDCFSLKGFRPFKFADHQETPMRARHL